MAEELYLRLYRELNLSRFDSRETGDLLAQLGPPALAYRGFNHARRRAWSHARADFLAAIDSDAGASPQVLWLCGAGLFVTRDYDQALVCLRGTAERAASDVDLAARARKLALKFATALGWSQEARELRDAIAAREAANAKPQARSLELRRQAAIRRRAQQAIEGAPAEAATRAYSLLFHDGPTAASDALDLLLHRFPEHPAVVAARLRLDLLLDQLEAADARVAALPDALLVPLRAERAALALAWGDGDTALTLTQEPGDDPRLLYLRALAIRLVFDDLESAAELLERARTLQPGSVPIQLLLALTRHQYAPQRLDEDLEYRFDALLADAPGLIADAAASLGIELWTDNGSLRTREPCARILMRAQGMLTAEHDLQIATYARRSRDGVLRLRHVAPINPDEGHTIRLHREDDELIAQHESLLVGSIGVRPPRPEQSGTRAEVVDEPTEAWQPRYLSQAQIDQFLADGMLTIKAAFDPELARRWREDGVRRIREEPEQWVRGYSPSDLTRSLEHFSPSDPETWTWSRIDLTGPETLDVPTFAPEAWAAICDLLGGPQRIANRTWGQYLILNLREGDIYGSDKPGPSASGWHIDDPNPLTRLDRLHNGLVCIALFDTLLPASGNTWLALDSVPLVARELAAHPEGVDFVNERGRGVTIRCQRFHEVVGETGDIILLHPLMMHTASRNRSNRIRWMANPMVYLKQPLNPFRPVELLSPVELAIHRAIQGAIQS